MTKLWEKDFPNLGDWKESSLPTTDYNCFAFAAGDTTRWWEPQPPGVYYWPPGVSRGYDIASVIEAYKAEGFQHCADGSLVQGREKIVFYLNRYGGVEHVARQLPDGRWTSKMGGAEDIEHDSPQSLSGGDYGAPQCYMEREFRAKQGQCYT